MPRIPLHRTAFSTLTAVALLTTLGCASSGGGGAATANSARPCPGMKVLLKVERTASKPTYKCVYKEDLDYIFERPTDQDDRRRDW